MVTLYLERKYEGGFWGTGNVLFIGLCADYIGVFTYRKFFNLYVYCLYIFSVFMLYFNKKFTESFRCMSGYTAGFLLCRKRKNRLFIHACVCMKSLSKLYKKLIPLLARRS